VEEIMMKIEILGTGCPKCKILEENAKKALEESGKKADVIKVTEIDRIIDYGVMSTPAIVIDGVVKSYGKVLSPEEIKKWLI
jgi:small redox-active disulfide protein 2